jgi:hypothetical protein
VKFSVLVPERMVARNWSRLLAAAEEERREQQRHAMPLRIAQLITKAGQELCVIRNISGGGLQGRVYSRLDPGAELMVELQPGRPVPARIVWFRDWHIGVEFLRAINVDQALGACTTNDNGRNVRLPRLEVSCPGRLQIGPRAYAARLRDISEGGAKVELRTAMKKLSKAILTLPDLPPCEGFVRWVDGMRLGLGFDEPLPHEVIARWAEARGGKADPDAPGSPLDRPFV